jgi:hypothetical protein
MTIHFHTQHFKESRLSLVHYMFAMVYEQKEDWTTEELCELVGYSPRQVVRLRNELMDKGILERIGYKFSKHGYRLTDKLYPK